MDNKNLNTNSWSKDADYRLKNRKWLRYSSNIARRILAAIEDKKDFNQAELARTLGVSPQQVSKIVKGKENLTLETIANISTVLDKELISFPDYKYSSASNQITQHGSAFVNAGSSRISTKVSFQGSWLDIDAHIILSGTTAVGAKKQTEDKCVLKVA